MTPPIQANPLTLALSSLLEETFENVHGYFLDRGTSFFEALATISSEEASIPVGGRCATLAAQVRHVAFYLDVLEEALRMPRFERHDWDKIWRETGSVTTDEWEASKIALRASYDRIKDLIASMVDWSSEQRIGGAIAVVAHTAYHLGEIRQALCMIKQEQ